MPARPDKASHGSATPPKVAPDCALCPRLVAFREENKKAHPSFYNGAVPSFGPEEAQILIIGLAPGLKGANQTGRPFTGDWAGDLLYQTLLKFGLAEGEYKAHAQDGIQLKNCRITNAVRCVPPQNKPVGSEINTCRRFLGQEMAGLPNLKALFCLGKISHDATIRTLGLRLADYPFAHNARHNLGQYTLYDSYHCSRYNTNTGRLTEKMFEDVFENMVAHL